MTSEIPFIDLPVNNKPKESSKFTEFDDEENGKDTELDVGIDDGLLPTPPPQPSNNPDINLYQHKKTLAQGMMDLALLTANANQLRYVLETGSRHNYYLANIVLICCSLFLQIGVGICLIWNSRYNVNKGVQLRMANKVNNVTVICIFIITVLNVFIAAFGIPGQSGMPPDVEPLPKLQIEDNS